MKYLGAILACRLVACSVCIAAVACVALGCSTPREEEAPMVTAATRESVLSLFDSLAAIHTGHPDTGLLRRLHPVRDSLVYAEGSKVESMTGDSLFRRVLALHVPVRSMTQTFSNRSTLFLDPDHAILSASERVDWVDDRGPHTYLGVLTIAASRRGGRWVIRAYRGT